MVGAADQHMEEATLARVPEDDCDEHERLRGDVDSRCAYETAAERPKTARATSKSLQLLVVTEEAPRREPRMRAPGCAARTGDDGEEAPRRDGIHALSAA